LGPEFDSRLAQHNYFIFYSFAQNLSFSVSSHHYFDRGAAVLTWLIAA
jgi:hypothetical protein